MVTNLHFYPRLVLKLMNDTVKTSYNLKVSGKKVKEDVKLGIYVLRLWYNSRH